MFRANRERDRDALSSHRGLKLLDNGLKIRIFPVQFIHKDGFRDSLILRGWREVVPYSGEKEVRKILGE